MNSGQGHPSKRMAVFSRGKSVLALARRNVCVGKSFFRMSVLVASRPLVCVGLCRKIFGQKNNPRARRREGYLIRLNGYCIRFDFKQVGYLCDRIPLIIG